MKGRLELRCVCSKRTLLGLGGRDTVTGEPWLHVKVYKQGRVFGELVASSGVVRIRCRNCLRWHAVTFRREVIDFVESPLPETIPV